MLRQIAELLAVSTSLVLNLAKEGRLGYTGPSSS
jgi:hypothetical protein